MLHIVAGVLFFLLSPGVLLTIPAGSRGLFASGQTSMLAAAVHATVFVVALYFLKNVVIESFASSSEPVNRAIVTPLNGKVRGMKPVVSCVGNEYNTPCKIVPRLIRDKESVGFCSSDNWCIASPPDSTIITRDDANNKNILSTYTPA